jgi:hypothetical protein
VTRTTRTLITLAFLTLAALGAYNTARADPKPIRIPAELAAAREACPNGSSLAACRGELRRAYEAVAWAKKEREHEVERILARTRGKQPYAYAARLAEMACRSFSATPTHCRPASEMLSVGRCESGLQSHDPNPASSADGWMQFLSGTWNNTTAGRLGFSRYDVLAMGIATADLTHHDHGWSQWTCKPAA